MAKAEVRSSTWVSYRRGRIKANRRIGPIEESLVRLWDNEYDEKWNYA